MRNGVPAFQLPPDASEFAAQRRHRLGGGWVQAISGAVAGLLVGLPVGALMRFQGTLGDAGVGVVALTLFLLYATATGAAIGLVVGYRPRGLALAASGGVLIGLLGWLLFSLSVDPVLHGQPPTWSVEAAAQVYPALVGGLLHGGAVGLVVHLSLSLRARKRRHTLSPAAPELPRVVIIGGGFGGLAAARRFEELSLRGVTVDVTLISDSNFLLFTPMLAEVASSALEPTHISTPVRERWRTPGSGTPPCRRSTPMAAPYGWPPSRHRMSGLRMITSSSPSGRCPISSACLAYRSIPPPSRT